MKGNRGPRAHTVSIIQRKAYTTSISIPIQTPRCSITVPPHVSFLGKHRIGYDRQSGGAWILDE